MLHVQQQHAAGVGVVAAVDAGEDVVDVVLRQHYLGYPGEVLRLVFAHPEYLGRGEAGEGDVRRQGGEPVLADGVVEVVHLVAGAPVVPEYGRADDVVVRVQRDKAVHLAAGAYAGDLGRVKARDQLRHALHYGGAPVLGVLLAPARVGEGERIFLRYGVQHRAALVHEEELDRAGAEVYSYVEHKISLSKPKIGRKRHIKSLAAVTGTSRVL